MSKFVIRTVTSGIKFDLKAANGQTIATFATEREAVEFAKQFRNEHEAEFNPVWGGVGITDQEGSEITW